MHLWTSSLYVAGSDSIASGRRQSQRPLRRGCSRLLPVDWPASVHSDQHCGTFLARSNNLDRSTSSQQRSTTNVFRSRHHGVIVRTPDLRQAGLRSVTVVEVDWPLSSVAGPGLVAEVQNLGSSAQAQGLRGEVRSRRGIAASRHQAASWSRRGSAADRWYLELVRSPIELHCSSGCR